MSAIFIAPGFNITVNGSGSSSQVVRSPSYAATVNITENVFDANPREKAFYNSMYKNYFHNHQKNCISKMINAVNAATLFLNTILAVTGISIPNLSWLFSTTQETTANKISNGYEITVNAGRVTIAKAGVYRPSISYGYWTFLWGFIPEYHLKNFNEFGSCFDQYFEQNESGTIKNPITVGYSITVRSKLQIVT